MDELFFDLFTLIFLVAVFYFIWKVIAGNRQKSSGTGDTAASNAEKSQIVQDIKATPTARVVDQVSILDELNQISAGHRQYCELIGKTQATSNVIAPYSKRPVAYYDLRCFRIDRTNGRDIETLVAQERSIDPFYFTDDSCDTPIYVSLESFGSNCILVNSSNHVEGPNSDFSKALSAKVKVGTGTSTGSSIFAVGLARSAELFRDKLLDGFDVLNNIPKRLAFVVRGMTPGFRPAYAGVLADMSHGALEAEETPRSMKLAQYGRPGGMGGRPGGMGGMGGRPGSLGGMGYGGSNIPSGLDSFLGLGGMGLGSLEGRSGVGGPHGGYYTSSNSGAEIASALLNIGLGAMMMAMSASSSSSTPRYASGYNTPSTASGFLGYRIVEDVVPLDYSVYCLGELFKNGTDVYMGKSLSKSNTSYYFATKLEADVIAHLQK